MAAILAQLHWMLAILCVVGVAGTNLQIVRHPPVTLPAIHLGRQTVQLPTVHATSLHGASGSIATSSYGIQQRSNLLNLIPRSEINDFPAYSAQSPLHYQTSGNALASGGSLQSSANVLTPLIGGPFTSSSADVGGATQHLSSAGGFNSLYRSANIPLQFQTSGNAAGGLSGTHFSVQQGNVPLQFQTSGNAAGGLSGTHFSVQQANMPLQFQTRFGSTLMSPQSGLPLPSSFQASGTGAGFSVIPSSFQLGNTPLYFQARNIPPMGSSGTVLPGTSGGMSLSMQPSVPVQYQTSGIPAMVPSGGILPGTFSGVPLSFQSGSSNMMAFGGAQAFPQSPANNYVSYGSTHAPMSFPINAANSGITLPMQSPVSQIAYGSPGFIPAMTPYAPAGLIASSIVPTY